MNLLKIKDSFFLLAFLLVFISNAQSADDEGDENDVCCEVAKPQQTKVQEKFSTEEINRKMKTAFELHKQGKTTEAASIWENLATLNYIPAVNNLAGIYTFSGGIDSVSKGRVWSRKLRNLAENKFPNIQDISNNNDKALANLPIHLAISYEYGLGVKKNRGKAYDLYEIAASRGNEYSKKKIASKKRSEWIESPARGFSELKVGNSIDTILQHCKPINFNTFKCFNGEQRFQFEIAFHPYPIRYSVGNNKGIWELNTFSDNEKTSDIEIQKISIMVGQVNRLALGEGTLYNDIHKQLSKNYNLNRKPTKDELANFFSLSYVDINNVFDDGRVLLKLIKNAQESSFYDVVVEYRDQSSADTIMDTLVKRPKVSEY